MFEREITTVYTASYFQLETERLHIEVWDMENFYLNRFMAYNSIPLADIVDGPMQHTVQCFPITDAFEPGKLNSTVNLKVNLAEIWDYYIEFMDWKTTSLLNLDNKDMAINCYVQIEMDSSQAIRRQVSSSVEKNTIMPYWAKIEGGILFRGTYHELKAQELLVTLYNKKIIGQSVIGSKII